MKKENTVQETTKPMVYDVLLCGVFLQELADKHAVDVTKLMVGKIGKELYVWGGMIQERMMFLKRSKLFL